MLTVVAIRGTHDALGLLLPNYAAPFVPAQRLFALVLNTDCSCYPSASHRLLRSHLDCVHLVICSFSLRPFSRTLAQQRKAAIALSLAARVLRAPEAYDNVLRPCSRVPLKELELHSNIEA